MCTPIRVHAKRLQIGLVIKMYEKKITKKRLTEIKEVCNVRKRIHLGCRNCVFNELCEKHKDLLQKEAV